MSEENNLSSNSICTTEDAFEKFQACAMYEEDEFITLSDIVPPQPEVPDLSNELNEIPYDNEVVLTSSNEDDTPLTSNIESNQHPNSDNKQQDFGIHKKEDSSVESHENKNAQETFNKINKTLKRGRKKAKSTQNLPNYQSDSSYTETENNSFLDNQAVQDNVLSTTVDKNSFESSNDLPGESKYPRRTRRERIPNILKYPLISETSCNSQSPSGRRRGRPKKSSLQNLTISEPDSTFDTLSINEELSHSENGEPVSSKQSAGRKGRRGRPPKASQAGIEQINPNDSSNNISESTDTELPLVELKRPTRRGRKKMEILEKPVNSIGDSQVNKHESEACIPEAGISQLEENNVTSNESKQVEEFKSDDMDVDDDGDDICLSKLKENINNITENLNDNTNEKIQGKINDEKDPKVADVADFEYHIDQIVQDTSFGTSNLDNNADESLLVEDTSKRPNRRKTKQNFKYVIDSDEDPFANVELSEDDEPVTKKKGRYADDEEYIPSNKKGKKSVTSSSDSELNEDDDGNLKKIKRSKRGRKKKSDIETIAEAVVSKTDDEPLSMKPPAEAWATSNEFENFIAQKIQSSSSLKIKKVSSKQKTDSVVTPLDIPVLNQVEPKKSIECGTQTGKTTTTSTGMQTSVPYDIPMKVNMNLTSEQSKKACAFLNSVVKTTAELGQLMKDKSEDFMKKKINTDHVTDTFKMDYCVRKSFLLFKLAKHNLMQMEEDLAKQYDEFLRSNNLTSCREELKNIVPKSKVDSDSDCEIVDVKEVPATSAKKEKPKLNKTVFLNKELSIKIAKKPSADKNVDVKGRHTIWINDSVMVKKVKPTQSFLAQDSRNKKPPDYVTEKMVSDFFENYYHQRAMAMCAPYISTEWSGVCREYACHYFVKCNDFDESNLNNNEINPNVIQINARSSNGNYSGPTEILETQKNNPKSLASHCVEVVRKCLYVHNVKGANEDLTCDLTDGKIRSGPLSLFRLCYQCLPREQYYNMSNKPLILNNIEEKNISLTVPLLKSLCYRRIAQLMSMYDELKDNGKDMNENINESDAQSDESSSCEDIYLHSNEEQISQHSYLAWPSNIEKDVKSLISLCTISIQTMYGEPDTTCSKKFHLKNLTGYTDSITRLPKPLKAIAYENIKYLMFSKKLTNCFINDPFTHNSAEEKLPCNDNGEDFTINCINTMSEEAFLSLEAADEFQDEDGYDYEPDIEDFVGDNGGDGDEWASHVQMKVLRSCTTPANNVLDNDCDERINNSVGATSPINTNINEHGDTCTENNDQYLNTPHLTLNNINISMRIKLEPQDDIIENIVDSSIVKTEPIHGLDGMTIIPESIITKSEIMEPEHNTGIEVDEAAEGENTAFNVNTFQQFVRKNKVMKPTDEDSDDEDMFSQSGLRVRREHEPDYDAENDVNESLLVPHTYEPLHIDNAKGVLMESSSDEGKDGAKKQNKKKNDKKRGRQKKGKEIVKNSNPNEIPTPTKEVPVPVKDKAPSNEVAILTRKMREKIRQEEKKIESSDSETDNIALSLRKDKHKSKENERNKLTKNVIQNELSSNKNIDNEIQCSNVDSTDQTLENRSNSKDIPDQFTGFTAIDQNEISSYQKYMQYVYDKIVPPEDDSSRHENVDIDGFNQDSNRCSPPLMNPDQAVELLECEPTMPIFDDVNKHKTERRPKKSFGKKKENKLEKEKPTFTERDGWHLYNIDTTDVKLYQKCHIPLEKLPESFVDTYLEYHDITDRDNIDKEVDRLANLQSLNRATSIKESKTKSRQKVKSSNTSGQNSENVSRAASPAISDHLDELSLSEDESANVDDELPPPVPVRTTENVIAKDSLMDDNESDSDVGTKKIKEELIDGNQVEERRRPGPKSKTKMNKAKVDILPPSESLMLTADKMMNKELTLLHAPIVMKEEPKEVSPKEPPKEETKPRKRSSRTLAMRDRLKTEDDSSSEEEKQWVSTKEKLLKRIGKKEDATADDAKRAKLVVDFIERRGEGPDTRRSATRTGRRSRKKMLERLKQQRVLSKELLGEPSVDLTLGGKRGANVGLFKGRRNIRKVIDKKSLQKSTVLANMEEFERKRRLNSKLSQLRELLGCEEGVNVLVINDEVCLEYDFQEQRPVVTVHPFFTKVMKAHQYEGVKFMWDACFESLASIESGHGGGGCILAHCMGLGKTLQVLALLHTVLTHPRAGMHRVLVCCPLSTVLNWVDEIHKWIGPVTDQIKVFELSKLKKTYERAYQLEDWYNGGGIFIIGYELFRSLTTLDPLIDEVRPTIINKIRTALLDPGPDIIICDEGHLLKNDCSVLAVAMSRVVTRRRIVLTGTPMQNNLREYYCMVNFVKPNLLGTYSEYSNRFENPIMNGQHRDSREEDIKLMKARTHILHKVLEGCLQRQEASVLYPYLPKKHEYTVFIPLTKCQWDLYKHYVHHYTKESKQSVLRDFHILQKIWSHPLVLHNFSTRDKRKDVKQEIKPEKVEDDLALEDKEDIKPPATETWWLQYLADGAMLDSIDCSNKFVAVFRILHECIALGDKLLIFSTSLDSLDALEYFLRQINGWNLGQEYYRLDGSVPAEVRQKWVREYNAENNLKTKLFLISTRAGCLGLNMTAANRVIILDTSWNPAHDIQSIFRVYRFGQKKDCYIYRLVAMGTMEQKIYERSVTKQAVACRVVDEQQIDRHYNMAELTELYRFDEHGVGVAGGVAVGVGDVVLLRVARDSAIHAVHEHDSLLRGSGEQGLPEHERAAAWMQFQQEHANKQMQNDMETDMAARALKKLQEQQQLLEQREREQHLEREQELERQQAQVLNIKTEDGPVHELLVPRLDPPAARGRGYPRGRPRGRARVVQCRIPIRADAEQPGPSRASVLDDEDMVQQISDILIKHNYTETRKGPQQIKELVEKVKRMTQSGRVSFEGCDELTASIAAVLMKRQSAASAPPAAPVAPVSAAAPSSSPASAPMPALTDVELEPRRRGRPRKNAHIVRSESPMTASAPPPSQRPEEEAESGGRRRRRAALAAERQFEAGEDGASQDSLLPDPVIELDDDDWQAAVSDTDSVSEYTPAPPAKDTKPQIDRGTKRSTVYPDDSSILLSDDSQSSPPPVAKSSSEKQIETATPLHASLLTNQNFIKIVAHTYLAGNPMLDEDAATLAAQYSTFKLLKETESTGKPIYSGPIYDIAMKVLGEPVLKKLQLQPSDTKGKDSSGSNAVSSKMAQFLGQDASPAPEPPPPVKKRPGPKSRVKAIKEEHTEPAKAAVATTTATQQKPPSIVPISFLRRALAAGEPAPPPATPAQAADECILPDDDDDVRCVTEPPPQPAKQPSFKVKLMPIKKEQLTKAQPTPGGKEAIRVTSGVPATGPAPAPSSKSMTTICLDSDDEDEPPSPAPAPAGRRTTRALPPQYSAAGGPVPVALTGPDSQPIPLGVPPSAPPPSQTAPASRPFYSYPTAVGYPPEPVPVSLTGPDSRPVPISLTGPDNRPVPISLTGPGFQAIPISMGAAGPQAAPVSYANAPMSFVGSDSTPISFAGVTQRMPMSFVSGASSMPTYAVPSVAGGGVRPVAMTYTGGAQPGPEPGNLCAIRLSLAAGQAGQAGAALHQMASNIYLVPAAPAGERVLTRVPASQVHGHAMSAAPAPLPTAAPSVSKTFCKPGDILRLTSSGTLEVIKSSGGVAPRSGGVAPNPGDVVHTIDDDENAPVSKAPTPRTTMSKTPAQPPKPSPLAPTPPPSVPTAPTPRARDQKTPNSLLKPKSADKGRKRTVSSSSSSSYSSRSPSPDPLSILRDVVHIQAPMKSKTKSSSSGKTDSSKRTPSTSQPTPGQSLIKPASKPSSTQHTTSSIGRSKQRDDPVPNKLTEILKAVKGKKSEASSSSKSTNSKATDAKIKDSIDLTELNFASYKGGDSKKNVLKGGKPTSSAKKDVPSTVVGTSKNIILDGKSKSLTNKDMVDLTGKKSIQVTNVKTISSSSATKAKPLEKKRTAPPTETAAPKKKKTEPMTLKDFDIDDIDDIIELD